MADTVPGDPRNLRKSILNVFVLLILIYGFFSGVCAVVVSGHVVEEVLRLDERLPMRGLLPESISAAGWWVLAACALGFVAPPLIGRAVGRFTTRGLQSAMAGRGSPRRSC